MSFCRTLIWPLATLLLCGLIVLACDDDGQGGDGDGDVDGDTDVDTDADGDSGDGGGELSCLEALDCVFACGEGGDAACVVGCSARVCDGARAAFDMLNNCSLYSCETECEAGETTCRPCLEDSCMTEWGGCGASEC